MNDYSLTTEASAPARVAREALAAWLGAAGKFPADGDGGFSDDGDCAITHYAGKPLKAAAVLILVIDHPAAQTVLFTQRTAHLTDHAGQISFPGGRVEESDRDACHTALREAEEETGIDAARVEILGTLPQYTTGTGYLITPVVGWMAPPVEYRPDPTEVDECFEVPLGFLLDERNHKLESAMYKGRMRTYYAIPHGPRYIWGATAGMLVTFARVLGAAQGRRVEPPVRRPPDAV